MADYILIRKSRNVISSVLHIAMNILLGVGSILLTTISGSWILGIALVIISKWRIFAVRPRYWLLNLKSSLVDLIVGVGFVLIAYCSGTTILPVHYLLAAAYTVWLILIKPKSSEIATELQSLVAVFVGSTAAVLICASLDSIFLVLACMLIGYAAARHILVQSDDNDFTLVTFVCGLISGEIAWILHYWLIVYSFGDTGIIVPQIALVLTVVAFLSGRVYKILIRKGDKAKPADVAAPVIFSLVIIIMMIVWFSKPIFDV